VGIHPDVLTHLEEVDIRGLAPQENDPTPLPAGITNLALLAPLVLVPGEPLRMTRRTMEGGTITAPMAADRTPLVMIVVPLAPHPDIAHLQGVLAHEPGLTEVAVAVHGTGRDRPSVAIGMVHPVLRALEQSEMVVKTGRSVSKDPLPNLVEWKLLSLYPLKAAPTRAAQFPALAPLPDALRGMDRPARRPLVAQELPTDRLRQDAPDLDTAPLLS
jgi:hypothetical protein